MTYEETIAATRTILAPAIAAATEVNDDATFDEQIEGWIATAINNNWVAGITPEALAALVVSKLGFDA
jgi:hypothetical protein